MAHVTDEIAVPAGGQEGVRGRDLARAAQGASIILAGKLVGLVFRVALSFVLARSLGAEQYGLYNLALIVAGVVASLAILGLGNGLVRYVSTSVSRGDDRGLWGTLQVGIGIPALLSFLLSIGLFLATDLIAETLFHEARLIPLLHMVSVVVPFLVLEGVLAAAVQGFKNMHYPVIAGSVVNPVVKLLVLGALIISVGLNAEGAVVSFVLSEGAAAIILIYFLNREFPLRRSLAGARRDFKKILAYSLPMQLSSFVANQAGSIQTAMLQTMATVTSVGIFAVASQFNMVGGLLQSSLHTATNPLVAQLHDKGDVAQLRYIYQMASKWSLIFNLPCFLTLVLVPDVLLSLLGKSYLDGVPTLIILAWATLVETCGGTSGGMLDFSGYSKLKLANSIVVAVALVLLSLLLIPRAGIIGAALAVLGATVIANLLRVIEVYILLKITPYNLSFLKPLAASALALTSALFTAQALGAYGSTVRAMAEIAVLLAVYVGALLALGLAPEERALLTRLFQRWRMA